MLFQINGFISYLKALSSFTWFVADSEYFKYNVQHEWIMLVFSNQTLSKLSVLPSSLNPIEVLTCQGYVICTLHLFLFKCFCFFRIVSSKMWFRQAICWLWSVGWLRFLLWNFSTLVEQVVCCKMTPLQTAIYMAFLNSKAVKLQMAANKAAKMSASSLAFITQIKKLCNRKCPLSFSI